MRHSNYIGNAWYKKWNINYFKSKGTKVDESFQFPIVFQFLRFYFLSGIWCLAFFQLSLKGFPIRNHAPLIMAKMISSHRFLALILCISSSLVQKTKTVNDLTDFIRRKLHHHHPQKTILQIFRCACVKSAKVIINLTLLHVGCPTYSPSGKRSNTNYHSEQKLTLL